MTMFKTPNHPQALIDRADELEGLARRLRSLAKGIYPIPSDQSLLEDWGVGPWEVHVLFGTRVATGKNHRWTPILVLDREKSLAVTLTQTYRLGTEKKDL